MHSLPQFIQLWLFLGKVFFLKQLTFFPSPRKCGFPEKRSNSLMDRILITYISSEKMAGVFTETVFGFLTVYAHR